MARLLDGPAAGAIVRVPRRSNGEPPDELPLPGVPRGVYLLAGLSGSRGVLPYRWFTSEEKAELRRWVRRRVRRSRQPGS